MLVLSRKLGEEIVLPENHVVLKVVAVEGNRVRLGITAPEHVRVFRREVWEAGLLSAWSGASGRETD